MPFRPPKKDKRSTVGKSSGPETVETFLKKISQQAKPERLETLAKKWTLMGHIAESAVGDIRLIRAKKSTDSKNFLNVAGLTMVQKTIDLHDQSIWALVKNLSHKVKTLRGQTHEDLLFMDGSRKQVVEWHSLFGSPWQSHSNIAKIAWTKKVLSEERDGARSILLCNEFLNEACVGQILTRHLADKVPHVIRQHDAFIDEGTGHLILDQAGHSLQRACVDMTLPDVQSIVLQMLVTLSLGAQFTKLKHHDMHLDNIFVNKASDQDVWNGKPMTDFKFWSQDIQNSDGSTVKVFIPNRGYLARIGDYGLSSATDPDTKIRSERVDYPELNAGEIEWGPWHGQYENCETYDIITLFSKFFLDEELKQVPHPVAAWFQKIQNQFAFETGARASSIGRPLTDLGVIPNMSIADFLKKYWPDALVQPMDSSQVLPIYERKQSAE